MGWERSTPTRRRTAPRSPIPRPRPLDGLFPTAKVIGGFDFVGEAWPTGAIAEDPDPIDCGPQTIPAPCAGGHGSHVADIIAGINPTTGKGVAPGAKILAYKVCSAISTSCNGAAMLKGVDAALDPNGDGNLADHADVMNLSIGSPYGQDEDDISEALNNAVRAGMTIALSSGNSADRPYITGSGGSAKLVISTAQTQVPSALLYRLVTAAGTFGALHQPWAAAPTAVSGPLVYDTTNTGTRQGCSNAAGANPWVGTPFTGKILLVDRGTCAVSLKGANGAAAGALAVIVANNVSAAPGDLPPTFSFGGGVQTVATYTVTLADGNAIKAGALNQNASINPANAASLVRNMVSSSSRGPGISTTRIKPDIGAPGASLSAEAGTGTGNTAFGGTSGASPMIAGSAALLLQAYPDREPHEIKSVLMNTAETNIGINPVGLPGFLAPITRIGGGEVRVDRAFKSKTAAWDREDLAGSLSFGYHSVAEGPHGNGWGNDSRGLGGWSEVHTRVVVVKNYSNAAITYNIMPTHRYAADAARGAIELEAPDSITVNGRSENRFRVTLKIDASKLQEWDLNGGFNGGDGYLLTDEEYDGYLWLDGNAPDSDVHLAWHVLPRRAALVQANDEHIGLHPRTATGKLKLTNHSEVQDGTVEVFTLTGWSPQLPSNVLPGPGDSFQIVDLKSIGVRQINVGATPWIEFGIDTYGTRAHPNYPAEFDIFIDSNRDGRTNFIVFNAENGTFASTGQNVTRIFTCTSAGADPCATGTLATISFTDADLQSGNVMMAVPAASVGLAPGQRFDFAVGAFDNYFTGALTDSIDGMSAIFGAGPYSLYKQLDKLPATFVVPAGETWDLTVKRDRAPVGTELGLELLYRSAADSDGTDSSRYEGQAIFIG